MPANPFVYAGIDDIYDTLFAELTAYKNDANSLIKTHQKNYSTEVLDRTNPSLYPWAFLSHGGTSEVDVERGNRRWSFFFFVPLVILTHSSQGDPQEMVTRSDPTYSPGTVDLQVALGDWYWKRNQPGRFGHSIIKSWTFAPAHEPTVREVQRLLQENEYVDGIQLNFSIHIINKHEGE